MSEEIAGRLARLLEDRFGDRLSAVVMHGSAVVGGFIEGLSDFDFYLFLHGPLEIGDLLDLHDDIAGIDPTPFDYLQMSGAIDVDDPGRVRPELIPGSFRVVSGALPSEAFVHTEDSLREHGREWLGDAERLLRSDAEQWATATGRRRTHLLRLLMTRLKPTVRALLAEHGETPSEAWAADYEELARRWERYSPAAATRLRSLVEDMSTGRDESRNGRRAIELLRTALVEVKTARSA